MPELDKLQECLSTHTFQADAIDELDFYNIHHSLEKVNFARITGLINPEDIIKAKQAFTNNFDAKFDRANMGETPTEIKQNFQKLAIGGAQKFGTYRPRCMRTLYNPLWAEDIYAMHDCFRKAAEVRNLLYGLHQSFAIDDIEDNLWTAARIHQYPAGGGFLISHRDTVVPNIHKKIGLNGFYQLIIIMSKAGTDFQEGGGFFKHNNERIYYEQACDYGDIVIYDGRTVHGVADIDPDVVFDRHSPAGRLAGFVTLYKNL